MLASKDGAAKCCKHRYGRRHVYRRPYGGSPLKAFGVDFDLFLHDLKLLSQEVGIPASTVDKKIPSADPQKQWDQTVLNFEAAEEQCRATNVVILGCPMEDLVSISPCFDSTARLYELAEAYCFDPQLERLIEVTVDELNHLVCRDFSPGDSFYYGPGSSQYISAETFLNRRSPELAKKLGSRYHGIPNVRFHPEDLFSGRIGDKCTLADAVNEQTKLRSVTPDFITQVPKNQEVNRTIGIGSVHGIAAQHVIGTYIRKCLRSRGLDLNTLAEKHRDFALAGSVDRHNATLDFSMASDTISVGLVWLLLHNVHSSKRCKALFWKLMSCRADFYKLDLDGKTSDLRSYEKIAPMGCAFTFELESLLFSALARAMTRIYYRKNPCWWRILYSKPEYRGSSFGDDMILFGHVEVLHKWIPWFISQLAKLGLTVNAEKSYWTGDFRESCGADYRNGRFVRGFYLHTRTVEVHDCIRAWNFFKLYHSVSDARLSDTTFGKFLNVNLRSAIAFQPGYGSLASCNSLHDVRIPEDVIITDSGEDGKYVFDDSATKRADQRNVEVDSYFMSFWLSPDSGGDWTMRREDKPMSDLPHEHIWYRPLVRYHTSLRPSLRRRFRDGVEWSCSLHK